MKNQTIFSFLVVSVLAFSSCDKDDRCLRGRGNVVKREINVQPFDRVRLMGQGRVYLKQDSIQKVTIESYENVIDALKTNVSGGLWKIDFRNYCVRDLRVFNVYISLPDLKEAGVSGSGEIIGDYTFTTGDLELDISGSGEIRLLAQSEDIFSHISGSGNIDISGSAVSHDISISGSGDVKAFALPSETTNVKISGSGFTEVKTSRKLDVHISGSGDVYYKGTPGINTTVSGSGKVIDAN